MIRTSFARKAPGTEKKPMKGPKTRKCRAKGCMARVVPGPDARITWCSEECGLAVAIEAGAARKAKLAKDARAVDKQRKDKLKRRADYIAEAQVAFNAYIRERDRQAGHPCISSGLPLDWSGNNVDAGHYRSRGSAPHLRFDERNCHAQSKKENRYASGNAIDYRIGLIARIGQEAVDSLERDQASREWTIEDLQDIKATYRVKLKLLKENAE